MRTCLGPVELHDQVGETVDHARGLGEPRRGVDHAVHHQPGTHTVKVTQLALEATEDCQSCRAGGLVALLRGDLCPYLAKGTSGRAVWCEGTMPRDVDTIAIDPHPGERCLHRWRELGRLGKGQPEF